MLLFVISICLLGLTSGQPPATGDISRRNFRFNWIDLPTSGGFLGSPQFSVDNQHDFLDERESENPYNVEEMEDMISVSCHVRGKHMDHEVFHAFCPPECNNMDSELWGLDSYHEDSYICAAAIHAGIIDGAKGGKVVGRLIESSGIFVSVENNGIMSQDKIDLGAKAFIFQVSTSANVPTYIVDCYVTADQIQESEFRVLCPKGCDALTEMLFGSVKYSSNSYLCAAAIHDGKITAHTGGLTKVKKITGAESFLSERRHRVQSQSFGQWPTAFEMKDIIEQTSTHLEVSCDFRGYHVAEETFTVSCPPGCDVISDQVYGTGVYTVDSYVCAAAIHDGKIFAASGGEVTLQRMKGYISFDGSGQNNIVTKSQEADVSHGFFFVDSFTRAYDILEVSCRMEARFIQDDVATVMCEGSCDLVSANVWGKGIFTDDSYICAAAIADGRISHQGGVVTIRKMPPQKEYAATTANGIRTKAMDDAATGAFKFEDILQDANLIVRGTCDLTSRHISSKYFTLECPPGCDLAGGQIFGDGVYTVDSRLCQAAIHDGRITGSQGGMISVSVDYGKTSFGSAKRNGVLSSFSEQGNQFFVFNEIMHQQKKAVVATCKTQSSWIHHDVYTAICPRGCTESEKLYGTGTYSDDSYLCSAAAHDGRIQVDTGGLVIIRKRPGLKNYAGMELNSITSNSKEGDETVSAFRFSDVLMHKESTFTVSCALEGILIQSKKYAIICPPECDKQTDRVWGFNTYTDDSYICAAAIQAGKIDGRGGRVNVQRTEESTFGASEENGVESKSFEMQHQSAAFNFS